MINSNEYLDFFFNERLRLFNSVFLINKKSFEMLFDDPCGIHGITHSYRVAVIALIILFFMGNRSERDALLLLFVAKYHDIGRLNNGKCEIHGYRSWNKIETLDLMREFPVEFSQYERQIIKMIIENHCLDDAMAIVSLKRYFVKDENALLFLFSILKDADALDRVRFNGLQEKFLRNHISKELITTAEQLLTLDLEEIINGRD
jgi:HD superfamily phosphodiesterase